MTTRTTPVVTARNLRKSYGTNVAVKDVSFDVHPGEILGILGPNGAGKTTSVECVAGLRTADGGHISVLGQDPQVRPDIVKNNLGVQLQESVLPAKITVWEALHLYASFYENPAEPNDLIKLLGLTDKRNTRFANLSGGQKQRVSIALALVGNPKVAILDELTTGLDPQARRDTWEIVERVRNSGVTIILVTHFMEEAERLCDRVVIIDHGEVVAEGTPSGLIADLSATRVSRISYATDVNLDQLRALDSVSEVERVNGEVEIRGNKRALADVITTLAAQDIYPEDIRTISATLDDVFVHVTGRAADEGGEATPGKVTRKAATVAAGKE